MTLGVRHIAHPGGMQLRDASVLPWELWAWSGAWLVVAASLMVAGLLGGMRAVRLAALAVMAAVTLKVLLIDMSGLTGLWLVLSFLGLGLTLIGLGRLHGRLFNQLHSISSSRKNEHQVTADQGCRQALETSAASSPSGLR